MSRRRCRLTARLTDGRTAVDRRTDEHETSRQQQYHHTTPTPDATAARWTDAAASTSTDLQSHDSTVGDQGDASTTDGQTNVDWGNVVRDSSRQ